MYMLHDTNQILESNGKLVPFGLTCGLAVLWMVLVCLSRLYLGVHSPLDIICGASLALFLTGFLSFFMEDIDIFLQTHPLGAFVATSTALALCTICYPKIVKGTTGKGDAVQIVSSVAGICLGSWLNFQYGFTHIVQKEELLPLVAPNLKLVATSILRFFIGVIVIALIRTVVKSFSIKLSSYCLGLEKPDKKDPRVETAYKFLTYYCIGVVVICTIPMVHGVIGLGRPNFSSEVL
ncbi:hypothetical protein ACJMK2_023396 [Sinanodonta woodiana]|uniref:Phosphatidic acid phosphatase type 2/haloperoxidase domain-containing protein n=1 Tax=Sinanodonta woodiana TaxID=1069815 RepID=A0ABD3T5E9_SINWO